MADQNRIVVGIGGIVFAIVSEAPQFPILIHRVYHDFLTDGTPEIAIRLHYGEIPPLQFAAQDLIFDSGAVWSLYRSGAQYAFALRAAPAGEAPYCVAVFDSDFRQGDVFGGIAPDGSISNPLEYPLSEVLMVCLLARQRGLMVHACGISDNGRGLLFAGNSTHGKSTMARIWRDQATILNDDRIVLRPRDGRIWMYGTPWHGEYSGVSPQGVPLDALFILRHSDANQATPLGVAEAASGLLTRCFPPLWDAAGMEYTLDFCAQIAESVPCYDLGFAPNPEIIDTVRCVK